MTLTNEEIAAYVRRHKYGVISTLHEAGGIESAVIGIAVSHDLEIVFDTLGTSRKYANLARDHRVAAVIGWENEQTLQIEGVADTPENGELERIKQVYFDTWGDDGRSRSFWPGIAYVRIRPTWLRFSDYKLNPPRIEERTLVL
jgi:general stress protein 26